MKNLIFLFVILLAFSSCQQKEIGKPITQGRIEYDITYPNLDSGNVLVKFMPDKMTTYLKNDVYKVEFVAGLGLFKTGYISNNINQTMNYILKLVNVKYQSAYDTSGVKGLNDGIPEYKVEFTNVSKEIAGYTCYEALIKFNNEKYPDFKVYYTNRLPLTSPNWCNPLHKIPGLMFEYELTKYGLTMKFTATGVYEEIIDDAEFKIPKDYEEISNKRMEYKLKETFMNFQN